MRSPISNGMQGNKKPSARIKICYIITKGVWGGAQRYVYTLATTLPSSLFDVFVIVGEGGILKRKLEEQSVRVYELPNLKRDISFVNEFNSSLELLKIVWRESPQVLHLNSPKASGFGAVAGRLCFTPKIIQTIHGWSFNENRNVVARSLIWFFSWITTVLCHKTIIIAKSEKEPTTIMPFVDNKKISLIRNGVEPIKFINKTIVKQALLGRIGKSSVRKTLWFGTISELHKNKGLEYAIRAMSKIKEPFAFFILGEGEERNNLKQLVRELGLEDKVFLVGFVEDAKLYLKAFDVFLLTSEKEGLPFTILEAGLASLPVIASHTGGIPEIIDDGVNGLLTRVGDSSQITKALEYFIQNPEKRKEFGKALEEKVKKEFSVDEMVKKTIKLYK
jgi:glycosyltransferase involved in cell wall biosynthesis